MKMTLYDAWASRRRWVWCVVSYQLMLCKLSLVQAKGRMLVTPKDDSYCCHLRLMTDVCEPEDQVSRVSRGRRARLEHQLPEQVKTLKRQMRSTPLSRLRALHQSRELPSKVQRNLNGAFILTLGGNFKEAEETLKRLQKMKEQQ